MGLFDELNSENFVLYAAKNYLNRQCQDTDEFYEDLNEFKYVKKLVNRFIKDEDSDDKEKVFRLILNHVIIIYNVFEMNAANRMFQFKFDKDQLSVVKPMLIFLNYIGPKDLIDVKLDIRSVGYCRKIKGA